MPSWLHIIIAAPGCPDELLSCAILLSGPLCLHQAIVSGCLLEILSISHPLLSHTIAMATLRFRIFPWFEAATCHVNRYMETVRRINELEPAMRALSDSELKAKTDEFRTRLAAGEKLDALLPEAFAVVREASCRVLGMRHFDVQLVSSEGT